MKLARYVGGGRVEIQDAPLPVCPPGGLLVRTEACGLCSGELMAWYLDRKIPHVLGHEVSGLVVESEDDRFPVGRRVFTHHHAPCMNCDLCRRGAFVHCPTWRSTRLDPGGMAEFFAVASDNLADAFLVDDLDPRDAALIEPIACTVKSWNRATVPAQVKTAVIGLGALGIVHMLQRRDAVGIDLNPARREHATSLGLNAIPPESAERQSFGAVVVCPGTAAALDLALTLLAPDGVLALFAPLPPGEPYPIDLERLYFRDLRLVTSYSCGPIDTQIAAELLRNGTISWQDCVSDLVTLDELPAAYERMAKGEILKAMVVYS